MNTGGELVEKNYYTTIGRWWDQASSKVEAFDRFAGTVFYGAQIASNARRIIHPDSPYGCKVVGGADKCRAFISATRFMFSIEYILTGKFLFEQDIATGDFIRINSEGNRVFGRDQKTNKHLGQRVFRHWADIVSDIVTAVGRFFSPVQFLAKIKAIEIGKHSKWVGIVIMVAFTLVTAICTVRSIEEMVKNGANKVAVLELLSNVLDSAAMYWENGFFLDSVPEVALAGAVIGTICMAFYIFKEIYKASDNTLGYSKDNSTARAQQPILIDHTKSSSVNS